MMTTILVIVGLVVFLVAVTPSASGAVRYIAGNLKWSVIRHVVVFGGIIGLLLWPSPLPKLLDIVGQTVLITMVIGALLPEFKKWWKSS